MTAIVHVSEFSGIGKVVGGTGSSFNDGDGAIQAAKGLLASKSLATTETTSAFNGSTKFIRVAAAADSYVKIGASSVNAAADPHIFLAAGTFDYFSVEPGQYLNAVAA